MKKLALILIFFPSFLFAQSGIVRGKIFNATNNQPIDFATVVLLNTNFGTQSDESGNYEIKNIPPGIYNLAVSYVGFKSKTVFEIEITNAKPAIIDVGLEENVSELNEVVVKGSSFDRSEESPVSLRTIGANEIQRNPGGNRDISKVIQSFPGVSYTVSFRNDIIIRGGAPNENRFYLDGVEVPNINHFATQGSSGGPVGMINVDFIKEVEFYSGAFPANRGNALSSVFSFTQKDGRTDKLGLTGTIGSSDFGLTLEGPLTKKSSFLLSARRSYLQFLFQTLGLPFLPTYNDFQFKQRIKLNLKNEITLVGLGAIDQFALNLSADSTDAQKYILGYLPSNEQWNYAGGVVYKHFSKKSFQTIVASRNQLNNESKKYFNNDETQALILNYSSTEIENKLRIENLYNHAGLKINYGAGYEFVQYQNKTYNRISTPAGLKEVNYNSDLSFSKYSAFAQLSKTFLKEKLIISAGARTDFNNYSVVMSNPLGQISPRISFTYNLNEKFSFSANSGIYFQLPAYTVLGYRDSTGELINKKNEVSYIECKHLVAGTEYNSKNNLRIAVEGFYKLYSHYPFLTNDSVSLANLGGDFGVVGNEPAVSTSSGKSYGVEFLIQQKYFKGFYGLAAVTLYRSLFSDRNNKLVAASWDNKIVVAATLGKKIGKSWELGIKWRYSGGAPFTPYDISRSSLISVWNITGRGLNDYSQLNSQRLKSFHQLDFRIDKKFFMKKWNLDAYIDVQNAYNYKTQLQPYLDIQRDANGNAIINPDDNTRYLTRFVPNESGTVLPTIGVVIGF
ncbi:MAG TPA: ferric aerobactin receptor [Bacteroidetes bacterium]|nr:ferric aerobactin receptor [Bacteroidota bacterium]